LLKSVSAKSFVSTEAAHSTAAFLSVKLFFENLFSTQPLALSISRASRQREAHITALNFAVKHLDDLLSTRSPEAKQRKWQVNHFPDHHSQPQQSVSA